MNGPRSSGGDHHRLLIATAASAAPMGAQGYQEQVASRAESALAAASADAWTVTRSIARSLRSPLPGTRRLPMGALGRMSHPARRALGAFAYPPGAVVHRMDLTLPPARTEVLTIHDTVAWRYPDEGNPSPAVLDEIRAAAAVICVSRNTANDLAALTGRQDAIVVHPGVDARFVGAAPLDAPTRSALGITGDYILHAGGASTRKNLEGLAEAWSIVESSVPEVSLVLAGPPHSRRDALFGGLPRVRRLGRVPDAAVPGLVAGAAVVVVPSHYEGFGLPVVEAMAAGTPVVVAKTSSLVEVGGDVAIMVEPDGASIAAGIFAALSSGFDREQYRVRASKRAATFDWDESVSRIAQVWRDVAASA